MERPHPLSGEIPKLAPTQDLRPFHLEERPRPIRRQPTVSDSPVNKPVGAKNLAKNILAGAALHVATAMAGRALPTQNTHTQEARRMLLEERLEEDRTQEIQHRTDTLVESIDRHERTQRERVDLVQRARRELEEGRFDFGRFLLATNRLDAREDENRPINVEEADRKLDQVVERFQEYIRVKHHGEKTKTSVLRALYYATQNYQYRGVQGMTLADGVLEEGGSCVFAANFFPAVLWRAGIHSVGQRIYAAPSGKRFGHRAGILMVESEGHVREVDLVSWGDPYRDDEGRLQGLYASIPDLVEWYAAGNGITPQFRVSREPGSSHEQGDGNEEGEVSANEARSRAASAFATNSGLHDGHFFFPNLPPTTGNAFPDFSPATSDRLMGVYLSENGRIYSPHQRSEHGDELFLGALERVYAPVSVLLEIGIQESIDNGANRTNISSLVEIPPHFMIFIGADVDTLDAALQHVQSPIEAAVISGGSLAYWSILQEEWTREHRPRTAQHAERMAAKRFQEFSRLLSNISEEEIFRSMSDPSAYRGSRERRDIFCDAMSSFALHRERGRPLLFGLLRRILNDREKTGVSFQSGDSLVMTWMYALAMTARPEEERLLWSLVQRLTIRERFAFYHRVHRDAPVFGSQTSIMSREFRAVRQYGGRLTMEMATGFVHTNSPDGRHYSRSMPRAVFYDSHSGTFALQRTPRWRNFSEFEQYVGSVIREQGLDPAWTDLLVFEVINDFIFLYREREGEGVPASELEPVKRILAGAIPWMESHHASLVARDFITEGLYRGTMQLIRR